MDGHQACLDGSGAWLSVGHPLEPPITVPFLPLHGESSMHSHHQNTFKTVTMTWVNGDTISIKIFLCCTARNTLCLQGSSFCCWF